MAKKRGQQEGSVSKRKDGSWIGQVSIQGKRHTKYFKSQKEALDWLHLMRTQIQAGLTFTGAQQSLSEYLELWLGSIRGSVKNSTANQYRQIAHDHIVPRLGKIKLKDLKPDQIQRLYNEKQDLGFSPRMVIMIHVVLHRALKQALKLGILGRNPTDAVTRPKYRRKEMNTLDDNQARALIMVAKGTRFEALFYLAISTGLREGELLGLKWSDLDWNNRKLHIQRQLQRVKGGLEFNQPKTAAGRRVITIGNAAIQVLRNHLNLLQQERILAGTRWIENDMVFPSTIGTPWDPGNMYHSYKEFLELGGLPNIRFHDLRHTAATLMLKEGVHPKVVQERLGHADITLTLNTYSHVLPSMQEEAADKLDELLTIIDVSHDIKKIKEINNNYRIIHSK